MQAGDHRPSTNTATGTLVGIQKKDSYAETRYIRVNDYLSHLRYAQPSPMANSV